MGWHGMEEWGALVWGWERVRVLFCGMCVLVREGRKGKRGDVGNGNFICGGVYV